MSRENNPITEYLSQRGGFVWCTTMTTVGRLRVKVTIWRDEPTGRDVTLLYTKTPDGADSFQTFIPATQSLSYADDLNALRGYLEPAYLPCAECGQPLPHHMPADLHGDCALECDNCGDLYPKSKAHQCSQETGSR